jgi:serine/threonine protein kinase
LLDENLIAKVSDFGISKENEDSFTHISTRPAGTAGYLDPEYFLRRQLTTASDVYGYGVLLLEIITGQQAIDHMRLEEMNLIRWVKPRFKKEGVERIVDPKLGNDYNKETMSVMTEVALMCAASSKNDRPSMKEVLTLLEPHLIARKPVAHSELLPSSIQSNNEKLEAKLYEGVTSEAMWANTTNLQQTKFSGSNTGSSTTSDITQIDPR